MTTHPVLKVWRHDAKLSLTRPRRIPSHPRLAKRHNLEPYRLAQNIHLDSGRRSRQEHECERCSFRAKKEYVGVIILGHASYETDYERMHNAYKPMKRFDIAYVSTSILSNHNREIDVRKKVELAGSEDGPAEASSAANTAAALSNIPATLAYDGHSSGGTVTYLWTPDV